MATQFDTQVRRQGDAVVIDLHGDINAMAEADLTAAYTEAEQQNPEAILLNFADVQYINSTGIALIVGLLARARTARRRLLACGLSQHYVEIFNITRLADFMTLFPNEESALEGPAVPEGAA
jgi:anti-anti-sigma factor